MGKSALAFFLAAALLRAAFPAMAQEKNPPPAAGSAKGGDADAATERNRVVGYSAWDDEYLYLAVQVNKPALSGKNSAPFSNPLEDDAIILSLQPDDDHKATHRTARTVTIAISEAGGMQLYQGEKGTPFIASLEDLNGRLQEIQKNEPDPAKEEAKRLELLGSIPKFQVTQKGTPRVGAANVPGYTVEIAIPWKDLGLKPDVDARIGFNVAAQSKAPGSPLLQSLSPGVKGISDLENPSLWEEIVLSNNSRPAASGALYSPRILANKPVIDGEVREGEWNGVSVFAFGEQIGGGEAYSVQAATLASRVHPDFTPQPPRPAVPLPLATTTPLAVKPHQAQKAPALVMALYAYNFQSDPRKIAPTEQVRKLDNSTALAHHPLEGTGPWFSYDDAEWHRRQLVELRRDGIDVILPVYRGDPRNRLLSADKGLTVLATTLQYLRQTDQDYPLVGLYLDTNSLIEAFGDRPDLKEPAVQAALYEMIRNFYRRIPAEFRCAVPLDAANGGRLAYPVFLSQADAFKDYDASFVAYLRGRFAADFDGADLVLLGPGAFRGKAPLDGYFTPAQEKSAAGDGWISTAVVAVGADVDMAAEVAPETANLRPRLDGMTYRTDWTAALSRHPDWILLDSWNDYTLGGEIAPSLEAGYTVADLTRVSTRLFAGTEGFRVQYLQHDVPPILISQSAYTLNFHVQNAGAEIWGRGTGQATVRFSYRWLRNGQSVANGANTDLLTTVLPGQNMDLSLPVRTSGTGGLPDGDYTLEILATASGRKGNATEAARSLAIPVTIRSAGAGAPTWAATLIRTDLPKMLEDGSVYAVQATLRNDGATAWRKADSARVTLRLYHTVGGPASEGAGSQTALEETLVSTADATAMLGNDVAPGQEVTVNLLLPVMDPDGKPLPRWSQDKNWTYTAHWEVAANGSGGVEGACFAPTPVAVVDFDFGVRFIQDATPTSLPGERRLPVALSLKNVGPQIWKKDLVRVGYHWYFQDGSEFLWEDETTALPQDLPPGGTLNNMLAWVTAPPCDGTYYLMWDVKFGDTWGSTSAGSRIFDQAVHTVQVVGGKLVFADLNHAYNLDGVTERGALTNGDFDGKGHTFPAALIPPFTDDGNVASGLWQPYDKSGPDSQRRISFRWGPKLPKEKIG